nr:hypothetical protein [Alistipes sp. Marseille-P5061]
MGKLVLKSLQKLALNGQNSAELDAGSGQIPLLFMTQNVGLEALNWMN